MAEATARTRRTSGGPRGTFGRRLARIVTAALLIAAMTTGTVPTAPAAHAATPIPFVPAFYAAQDNGAITLIGNSQLSCPESTACSAARTAVATTSTQSGINNNDFVMAFQDTDADAATTNSTSADLALPAGSTVLSALLVWGARRTGTLPTGGSGTISTAAARTVKFKAPGASSYATLTGALDDPALGDTNPYQGYLDVTAQVRAAGSGAYWVGDLAGTVGGDRYAGWSLIVAYRNPAAPLRDLRIFHGFGYVTNADNADIPITGFLTPASGTVSSAIGVVGWEGDRGSVGDGMRFGGQLNADGTIRTTGTTLSDATRPSSNFFDSSISDSGSPLTARNPAYPNNFGVDIGRINATNVLANGQTSTYVRLTSNGESYYPGVITTQIDLLTPAFNPTAKSVLNLSGNDPAKVGDTLRYQVSLTNTGADPADGSVLADVLPPNTTFVPGSLVLETNPGSASSLNMTDAVGDDQAEYVPATRTVRFRVGQGASGTAGGTVGVNQTATIRFRVTLDRASAGSTVSNAANLAYVAHTIGSPFSFTTNQVDTPVAQIADLAIAKSSDPATQHAGSGVTYRLAATNNGPNAAATVVLTDTLPAGITFVSASPPAGTTCGVTGQTVTCSTATLATGGTLVVPLSTTVAPGTAAGGNLTDVATIGSTTSDDVPGNNTASATTAITTSADVGLTKTVGPNPVTAGSTLTYTMTATNAGPSNAGGVTITDPLPLGLSFVGATGGCTAVGTTVTCPLGTLAPNQSATVTVTARVASNAPPATITTTATVTSTTPDPNGADNTATTPVTVVASADLAVTKTASAANVVAGTTATYTIAVTNNGPSDAGAVTLTDPAVGDSTILSAATNQGTCTVASNAVSCAIGTVANGSTVAVTVQARVDGTRAAGPLTNSATATSTTPDPTPSDNTGSATVTVITSADLTIVKSADPAVIVPGQPVTYTLQVVNNGPSQAVGVGVTDPLPTGLTFTSSPTGCTAAGQTVTCPVGTLANGATRTVTIVAAAAGSVTGTVTNTATVTATTPDPNPANNSNSAVSSLTPQADLVIATSASDPVIAGSAITYTLTVRNTGPSAASAVVVTDTAPAGITFTAATATSGACITTTASVRCTTATLANGATTTITVSGTVAASAQGTITNTAAVTADTPDPSPGNNAASVTSTIGARADVAVTLTGPTDPVVAGSTVTYLLGVRNNGPSTARGVVVTGQVPPGLTPVLGSSQGACVYSAGTGTVTCAFGDLPAGAVLPPIPLQAVVDPAQPPGPIGTTAAIGSTTPDTDPTNNSSTASITVVGSASVSIAKAVSPDPLVAGAPVTYTLTVTNAGPSVARDVVVIDDLDPALTILSANPGLGSCAVTGQHVECTAPVVPANSTMIVTVVARLDPGAEGSITNAARVASSTPDPTPGDNAASITTPVTETADVTLAKTASPNPIVAGSAVTYTLTMVNNGPSDADDVTLSDPLPAGFAVLSGGVTATGNACPAQDNATTVTCSFGTVEPGGVRVVQIRASTPAGPAAGSSVTNTATVASSTPDPDPAGRTATVTTPVTTVADLSVTKAPVVDPIEAGATQTYVVQVTNNGPSVSRGVVLTDPLPSGTTFVSFEPATGCDASSGTVTCSFGDLGRSETRTLQITVALDPGLGGTRLSNTASVASAPAAGSPTPDPNPADNSSTVSQLVATRSDLSLTKVITSGPIVAGSVVSYSMTATNSGPSNTTDLQLTDPLPAGTTLVTANASDGGTCQLVDPVRCSWPGAVPVHGHRTVTLSVQVPPNAAPGSTVTNTATVTSRTVNTTPDASTATAAGPVVSSADLAVTKSMLSGTPVAGGTATWQIVVRNAGPSQAANVVVDDAAPAGVTFATATPSPACAIAGGNLHCALGAVAAGASVTATVTGQLAADFTGQVGNTAVAGSDTPDPDTSNNSGTSVTDTASSADLSLTKSADSATFVAGGPASWTVRVSNAGPSAAAGAVVTDVVPAGVTGVAGLVSGGAACTAVPGTAGSTVLTCPVGAVTVGSPVSIAVTGTVLASVIAPALGNAASVASTTPDPDPTNNAASTSTPVTASADLSLVKTAPATAHAGEPISWQLTVGNAGPSDAQGGTVTDTLPAGLTGVSATGPDGACTVAATTVTCPVGVVPAGGTGTVTVAATIGTNTTGNLDNSAAATATTGDPNPANNTGTSRTVVSRSADVSVTKSFAGSAAVPGAAVSWTLQIRNGGPSTATDVLLTDTVPAAVGEVSAVFGSAATPCTVTGSDVSCAIGTVAPGQVAAATVTGTLAADDAGAILSNTATVSSPDDDDPPADNSSTSSTPVAPSADVSVAKALVSGAPLAGAAGRYVVDVGNAGPSAATGVLVTDQLPTAFAGATASLTGATGDCSVDGTQVTCSIGSLPVGATPEITIDGTFDQSLGETVTNTARVTADTPDPATANNVSSATGSVGESADLQLSKTGPATVVAGQPISWQLQVHNAGPSDAREVTVADAPPTAVTGATATIAGIPCDPTACAVGPIPAGDTVTIAVSGTVVASFLGSSITNVATVSAASADPDGRNNHAAAQTAVTTAAHLRVVKTVGPDPLIPGRDAQYRVVVSNTGPSDAQADVLTDPLPDGLTVRDPGPSATQGTGCRMIGRTASCDLGTLPAGQSATVTIPIAVDPGYAGGTVVNAATVSSTTPDTDPGGRTGTVTTAVTPLADLTLVKTGPTEVLAGDGLSWTLTLSNTGPSVARDVVITDPVPGSVTGLAASATQGSCAVAASTVTCTVGALAPGDTARITVFVTGTVDPSYLGGGIDNTATVASSTPEPSADQPDGRSSIAHTDVSAAADLLVTKVPSTASVTAGSPASWTVTVTNLGPSTATGASLTDVLPAGLRNPAFTRDGAALDCPGGECPIGTLAPGAAAAVAVTGTVDPALTDASMTNAASATATTADPVLGNNQASSTVPVGTLARLVVDKTGPATAVAGTTITWSIAVSNIGPSTARGVRLTDDLPAGTSGVAVNAPAGFDCPASPAAGAVLTCTVPDLAAGADPATVSISATVDPGLTGSLINSASATTTTPQSDPAAGDDTDSVSTGVIGSADLSVTKTGPAEAVAAGTSISWAVTVSNAGPSTARAVSVSDPTPAGVIGMTGSWSGGVCDSPCAVGDLASGGSVQITWSGTVAASYAGDALANTAAATSATTDPDPTNNSATASTDITRSADVSIVKTVAPDPLVPGGPVTYTLVVHNAGPSDASGVTVSDALPGSLTGPTAATSAGSCTVIVGLVACPLGALPAAGPDVTVTVTGTLAADADPGTVANTASVTATTPDPDLTNNSSTVSAGVATADLTIAKAASVESAAPGGTVTWRITVTNGGPGPARTVSVTDQVPAGVALAGNPEPSQGTCLTDQGLIGCTLGTLADGKTATVEYTGTVTGTQTAALTNSAATGSPDESEPGDNVAQVTIPVAAVADLSLTKSVTSRDGSGDVVAGGRVTWTLTVTNAGPAVAPSVVLTDPLPAGMLGATANDGCTVAGGTGSGGTVSCPFGDLAAGATVAATVTGTIDPSFRGTLANTATVSSAVPDPDPGNNSATASVEVGLDSRPGVAKTADRTSVDAGGTVTYTIGVTQGGVSASEPITVAEQLPAGATVLSATPSQGSYSTSANVWTAGQVSPGATPTLILEVRLDTAGSATNTVTLAESSTDATGSAKATVTVGPAACTGCGTGGSSSGGSSSGSSAGSGSSGGWDDGLLTIAPDLSYTGIPAERLAILGLLLLVVGGVLLAGGRRRAP